MSFVLVDGPERDGMKCIAVWEDEPKGKFRAYQDNVVIALDPLQRETESGLAIVETKAKHRTARVLMSGPGYYGPPTYKNPRGLFHANEVKPGDRVIVDALAGQNYQLDLNASRQNQAQEFQELLGERGEFRIVREEEILGVIEQ